MSERTLYNKRIELNIKPKYTSIDDSLLDMAVLDFHKIEPSSGPKVFMGFLLSKEIKIQRSRVRESFKRVAPYSIVESRAAMIKRQPYKVAAPLSLVHIDGNHKLIRWKFVIVGGIDGYSR